MGFLGRVNAKDMPGNAILFQSVVALAFILTATFEFIVVFAGALLALNSFLAVMGLFILRWREPDLARPYHAWGYPVVPLVYLAITGFTLFYVATHEPAKVLFAAGIIAAGAVFYLVSRRGRRADIGHD
ncbi:amino acid permease [Litorimonas sp. RW-G-Af-16]|uniref:amino acid permease n=1 Tax=Litorimonas sp. RW-G-Af-16 TaxID=3241168 RepID=UPI003AAB915C